MMLPALRALPSRWGVGLALAGSITALSAGASAQPAAVTLDLTGGVSLELVLIKAGSFVMGSPDGERGRNNDETERRVTLSADYYIGKVPVTRAQFRRFTEATGYRTEAERGVSGGSGWDGRALVQKPQFNWQNPGFAQADDHPVVLVTYDDARTFAGWLSTVSGRTVDLPTEARWEYAARAGTKTRFFTGDGDENASLVGWHKGNAGQGTLPVGQKRPNAWGLFDTSGNVWEWCLDFYGPYPSGPATDPFVSTSPASEDQPRRVLRGGSWLKDPKNLRPAARFRNTPGSRNADNGFRIVASVEQGRAAPAPVTPPPPPAAPPAPPQRPESSAFNGGCCVMLGVVGGFLLVIVLALRSHFKNKVGAGVGGGGGGGGSGGFAGGGFGAGGAGHGISLEPGVDGFWVRAPGHLSGATVSYRYEVNGISQQGSIVLGSEPARFVYTGGPTQRLAVAHVTLAAGGARGWQSSGAGTSGYGHSHSHSYSSSHDSEPFQGYPSAY